MAQNEKVLVVDFGGQYNQLIARRVRECNVYCEIVSYRVGVEAIKAQNPVGIIFTGGPNSVYEPDSPTIDPAVFELGVPVLGICYGSQLMMHLLGGHVCKAPEREYGKTLVHTDASSPIFQDVSRDTVCWMSHNDYIQQPAPGFTVTAYTDNCPVAAAEWMEKKLYAVAVPSRSAPYPRRQTNAPQLCLPCVRLQRGLENGFIRRNQCESPAGKNRQR